ncbi:MAG: hypothetical protein M3Q65_03705 [Chloroflexota bacterium]|nr:hypothetical protein [Chloroflexota bacterium]
MRLDIYKDDTLVATFEYGREPVYHDALGRQVQNLLDAPHDTYIPWTGDPALAFDPPSGSPDWLVWAAETVSPDLLDHGFDICIGGPS